MTTPSGTLPSTLSLLREPPRRSSRQQSSAARSDARPVVLAPPGPRRVAYLTNVYPKVSHSFIRTEIAALERQGFAVSRYTVRRAADAFGDEEDAAEASRTAVLLGGGMGRLVLAAALALLRRPLASGNALARLVRSGGLRSVPRACAYFAEAALLARRMTRDGVRHVHVHFGTNPAEVARIASRLAPITYSFTVHGPDEFDAPAALDLGGKIAEATFVAGVSSFGRSQLMRWSDPVHWSRIHVVRCAVSPAFLAVPSATAFPSATLVCIARLSAQKGLPLLIEAVAQVAASRPIEMEIIGDGEGRAVLEAQIARLGISRSVRLAGWGTPAQVRDRIENARALVLPSFAEGLPVVLMEALAQGRPVVTCAVAGIPELVDARVGWLVPAGSVKALAAALHEVLDASPEELRAMGEAGRERVRALHDPDANAATLAALLAPLV